MTGQDLIARIVDRLDQEFGMEQTIRIIRALAEEIGGVRVSFPRPYDIYLMDRDRRIVAEFTGGNVEELSLKYRLHRRQIRRIVSDG